MTMKTSDTNWEGGGARRSWTKQKQRRGGDIERADTFGTAQMTSGSDVYLIASSRDLNSNADDGYDGNNNQQEGASCGGDGFIGVTSNNANHNARSEIASIRRVARQQLVLEDKLKLLSGSSIWQLTGSKDLSSWRTAASGNSGSRATRILGDLPQIYVCDGPHGIRKPVTQMGLKESFPSTCFPTASALACSWNPRLLEDVVGPCLSEEAHAQGVSVLLGPGMNIKRHPSGGRNFEYFSEDPFLSGQMAAALVNGIQGSGRTGACLKHFAVNNQESHRFVVDAVVDERSLREIYLRNFEIALKICRPATIMCSYNKINGVYASEQRRLIREILRNEFGYHDGVVMTDWGATNSRSKGIAAGIDLEMPGSYGAHSREIREALMSTSGEDSDDGESTPLTPKLQEEDIDESCARVIHLIDRYKGAALSNSPPDDTSTNSNIDFDRHHELSYRTATECVVLLQNNDHLLPLASAASSSSSSSSPCYAADDDGATRAKVPRKLISTLALIGEFGRGSPRYQGMGSSQVNCALKPTTLYNELQRHVGVDNIHYARGYSADDDDTTSDNSGGEGECPPYVSERQSLIDEAVLMVQQHVPDVVVVSVGLPEIMESEGFDRKTLEMPLQQIYLVEAICQIHSKVVLVLSNGGAVQIPDSFLQASSILEGYLLGQAGAAAVADLIFGIHSPSGKLAETVPIRMQDALADSYFPGTRHSVEHREGLSVGYRFFDSAEKEVRFPFGHGLSYTRFEYDSLAVALTVDDERTKMVAVEFQIKNTGASAGSDIAQCYVRDVHASVYRPVHELKAFSKVALEAGETATVSFNLGFDAFAFYDIGLAEWVVEAGQFELQIGSSSRDIRLTATVDFATGIEASQLAQESYPPVRENDTLTAPVDDEIFAKRFGLDASETLRKIRMENDVSSRKDSRFDRNSLLKEVAASSMIGRLLRYVTFSEASKEIQPGPAEKRQKKMMEENVDNLPLRTLVLFSMGNLSFETLDALTAIMNSEYLLSLKFATIATVGMVASLLSTVFRPARKLFSAAASRESDPLLL